MIVVVFRRAHTGWGWEYATNQEACWRLRPNRANDDWWWRQPGTRTGEEIAREILAAQHWLPLIPGAVLRHGIGHTYWDGECVVHISGRGNAEATPWQPGEPVPYPGCMMYEDEYIAAIITIWEHRLADGTAGYGKRKEKEHAS